MKSVSFQGIGTIGTIGLINVAAERVACAIPRLITQFDHSVGDDVTREDGVTLMMTEGDVASIVVEGSLADVVAQLGEGLVEMAEPTRADSAPSRAFFLLPSAVADVAAGTAENCALISLALAGGEDAVIQAAGSVEEVRAHLGLT